MLEMGEESERASAADTNWEHLAHIKAEIMQYHVMDPVAALK